MNNYIRNYHVKTFDIDNWFLCHDDSFGNALIYAKGYISSAESAYNMMKQDVGPQNQAFLHTFLFCIKHALDCIISRLHFVHNFLFYEEHPNGHNLSVLDMLSDLEHKVSFSSYGFDFSTVKELVVLLFDNNDDCNFVEFDAGYINVASWLHFANRMFDILVDALN